MAFPSSPLARQQGVALLTILLLVVVATVLASSMLSHQQRLVRQAGVLLTHDQALQYVLGGEGFLRALLVQDQQVSAETDSLNEVWAQPSPPYPVGGGFVQGQLKDESGCFNLNSLYHDGAADPVAQQILGRLLKSAGIDSSASDAVLDWQDPDDQTAGAGGAENSFYAGQQPARTAANQPFVSVSELQAVRGFEEAKAYQKLLPLLCALPARAPLNVNTAPAEVLAALDEATDAAAIARWVSERDQGKSLVRDLSNLWGMSGFSNIPPGRQKLLAPLLGIKSLYYRAEIRASFDGRSLNLSSHLFRKDDQVSVYRRSYLPLPPAQKNTPVGTAAATGTSGPV